MALSRFQRATNDSHSMYHRNQRNISCNFYPVHEPHVFCSGGLYNPCGGGEIKVKMDGYRYS